MKGMMDMLDVKIQDSKKQYKGVILYEKYFQNSNFNFSWGKCG